VVALTARSRKEDRERCLAAGMDDFLSKPVRSVELFAAIERVVRKEEKAKNSASDSSFILHPSSFGAGLLDPAVLLAASGGDAEALREMCLDFRDFAPARLAEVADAIRSGDAPRLREAAHKLCGLISAFSSLAGRAASNLEDLAEASRLDGAVPLANRLEAMTHELLAQTEHLSLESLQSQARNAKGPGRTT
jgi:two-component system, sensor histidine kinase and response regulator